MQVFAEAEIRANVVFQISKLCSLLLDAVRLVTGTPAWEVLVSGSIPLCPCHSIRTLSKLLSLNLQDPAF